MNQKYLSENERMYYKIGRTIVNLEIAIALLILAGLLFLLFIIFDWTATGSGSGFRGSVSHDPISSHQVYRSGKMTNGKALDVPGPVNLVAMVETKKAIPVPGDGLLVKKSIFEIVKDSRPFESRQPMNPKNAIIGPYGCLFFALSDWWQFLSPQTKPLPRGCNSFIGRFLSDSDGIIDMMNHGNGPELAVPLLVHHSDYYSGIAL